MCGTKADIFPWVHGVINIQNGVCRQALGENDPAGVSFFHSILDQNTSFRPQKQTEKKITQQEGEGLQSLKIDDGNSPKDRYINFPPDHTLKSSRWFFSSFLLHS